MVGLVLVGNPKKRGRGDPMAIKSQFRCPRVKSKPKNRMGAGYNSSPEKTIPLIYMGAKGNYYLEIIEDTYDTGRVPYIIGLLLQSLDHDMGMVRIKTSTNEGKIRLLI